MTKLKTKMELEVLKVKIAIHSDMIQHDTWKRTDSPHMHEIYVEQLNEYKEQYLETLREILVPNKTYVMDLENGILPYDEKNNIVPFLKEHMIYGQYKDGDEDYLYDKTTPAKIHKYCDAGRGTMTENKSEIIECLYVSKWEFNVNPNGVTIITGRPYDCDNTIYVIVNKNIFETDMIADISLSSL
jgi:hypothetical protein